MIISYIITIVLNILNYFFGVVFLPFRLLFPALNVSSDGFVNIIEFILNTFKSVQDIFIYFSSSSAWRLLILSVIVNFVILPLVAPVVAAIRSFLTWLRSIKP